MLGDPAGHGLCKSSRQSRVTPQQDEDRCHRRQGSSPGECGCSCYAIINRCTHAGGSLAQGVLEGGIVTCPRHGARFDVKTGKAVGEAKIGSIKMKVKDEESCMVKVKRNRCHGGNTLIDGDVRYGGNGRTSRGCPLEVLW
jgi:nitrite reductase/ring-hydroxylating ferredoxin subunit